MRRRWQWLGVVLGLAGGLPTVATGQAADALTVVLVRHAEPGTEPARDPDLNDEGRTRAEVLARILSSANVTAVYATQFRRTQQTGQPVAEQFGLEVTVVQATAGPEHIADMVSRIRAHGPGEVVVVAGHSNTIPPMVNALTGLDLPDLEEDQFDRAYIVTVKGDGPGSLITLRYGRDTP